MTIINNEYNKPISSKQVALFIGKTLSHFMHENIIYEYYNANKENVFQISPIEIRPYIPSIIHLAKPTPFIWPYR